MVTIANVIDLMTACDRNTMQTYQFLQLESRGAADFLCCVSTSLDLILMSGAQDRRTTGLKHLRKGDFKVYGG